MTFLRWFELSSTDRSSAECKPSGGALIARHWSAWAGNLLLAGVILIGGLTFGRHVIHWWRVDSTRPVDFTLRLAGKADLGAADFRHALEFGSHNVSIYRKTLVGDQKAAVAALRDQTRDIVRCTQPSDASLGFEGADWLVPAGQLEPVAGSVGAWLLSHNDGSIPIVVGLRDGALVGDSGKGVQTARAAEAEPSKRHAVCWSVALAGEDADSLKREWTLFTFARGERSNSADAPPVSWPLPPGITRIMSIRAQQGSTLIGFSTTLSDVFTRNAFDHLAEEEGWTEQGNWRIAQPSCHRSYTRRCGDTIHVTFVHQYDTTTRGLVFVVPPN